MIPIDSPWPFYKWAIDIVGPFPPGVGNVKFLIVAIDYFTKSVEAKALRTITGVQVRNFVWEYIVRRFSISRELVSDNGAHIAKDPFLSWCAELNIIQRFTSVAHPQENGLCEAHRTTFKKSTGETHFSLVYGFEAMIPAEIFVEMHRVANFDESANAEGICENLNFIEERRLMAAIREANNKQQIAKYYNKKVRALAFDVGEWVLRNNEASRAEKQGKLGPNWVGPYQIVGINAAGSYKLQDIEGRNIPNAWHDTLLKRYYM
ncbi:uncharacterized protein [Rutidosis leptorrhynchoides]|uniref:uncharacterized protein n=1 Tax=Rutidosis leptorrhynchoides TaxID=125765 RepID=UPI003A9A0CD2